MRSFVVLALVLVSLVALSSAADGRPAVHSSAIESSFPPLWYRLNGQSLVGSELATMNSSAITTAFQCSAVCGALGHTAPAPCVGFSFDGTTCTLFSFIETMVGADSNWISGAMPPSGGQTILVQGYDLFGSDVHTQTPCDVGGTLAQCAACCAANYASSGCNAFTYIGASCYPKAFNVSGSFYNRGGTCVMGLMPFNFGADAKESAVLE